MKHKVKTKINNKRAKTAGLLYILCICYHCLLSVPTFS